MGADLTPPDKLSLVVFSGSFEKVHYALAMASAAAAINRPATLFFTMGAARALKHEGGWQSLPGEEGGDGAARDADYRSRGIGGFEDLLAACAALKVRFIVCEMGLRALGIEREELRDDIELEAAGLVTFLNDASAGGAMVFV